jgi:hypothetical protein
MVQRVLLRPANQQYRLWPMISLHALRRLFQQSIERSSVREMPLPTLRHCDATLGARGNVVG